MQAVFSENIGKYGGRSETGGLRWKQKDTKMQEKGQYGL